MGGRLNLHCKLLGDGTNKELAEHIDNNASHPSICRLHSSHHPHSNSDQNVSTHLTRSEQDGHISQHKESTALQAEASDVQQSCRTVLPPRLVSVSPRCLRHRAAVLFIKAFRDICANVTKSLAANLETHSLSAMSHECPNHHHCCCHFVRLLRNSTRVCFLGTTQTFFVEISLLFSTVLVLDTFFETLITFMKERIWINRVSSEIVFSVFASRNCPVAR